MPRLTKIYTRKGDAGETSLGGGQRVPKDRVARTGVRHGGRTELAARRGAGGRSARAACTAEVSRIQNVLFDLGSDLSFPGGGQAEVSAAARSRTRHVEELENLIDELNDVVGPLENFILPGGSTGRGALARGAHDLPARGA